MPSSLSPPTRRRSSPARSSTSTAAKLPAEHSPEGTTTMTALSGRTALVTGASRGIGRATARALAKAGAQVLVHYGRAAAEANALVAEIRGAGGAADAVGADLAAADGAHVLAQKVR